MSSDVLLQLDGIPLRYGKGETAITALAGVDLSVHEGELVAIPMVLRRAHIVASAFRILEQAAAVIGILIVTPIIVIARSSASGNNRSVLVQIGAENVTRD